MDANLLKISGYLVLIIVFLSLGGYAVVNQPRFGKLPEADRLDSIKKSSNYKEGKFQNQLPTPKFAEDITMFSVMRSMIFDKREGLVPDVPVPAARTDLRTLSPQKDAVVWMGHSSWYIQLGGKRFLIDPVLSKYAAPFSFANKAFPGTSIYRARDIPEIDYLLISHDHWDHLDYQTIMALKSKVKEIICPLGIGSYLEDWGISKNKIHEGDWNESMELEKDMVLHILPARHYSGRLFKENQTLWAGFAIITSKQKIFYSGDSGYGPHFSKIGKAFKGFNLVLLDCGQYDPRWPYIHMSPEEAAKAASELGAMAVVPAHVGRFSLANHPWDEPFVRLTNASRGASYRLLTPQIGELMALNSTLLKSSNWWVQDDTSGAKE